MHSLKFLLDADMPRSSGEVIRRLGFDIEDVRDIGMITIVELSRYRKRKIN